MTPTNDGPPGDDRPSFKEAMKRVIAERRKAAGPHPGLDTLAAYAAGELPEAEAERVRDHLALCAACTGTVLDLSILAGRHEVAEVGELSDADEDEQLSTGRAPELEAAWNDMRTRLARERLGGGRETTSPPAPPAPVAPVVEMPRRPERVYDAPNVRLPWTIAAVLAAACLGLGMWSLALSARQRELTRPRGVTLAEVYSPDDEESRTRGSSTDGEQVSSANGGVVTFVLPDSAAEQPAFRVEIRPVAGGELEVIEDVPSQDGGRELRILFQPGSLEPGSYEALVSPAGDGAAEPLRYPFEVGP